MNHARAAAVRVVQRLQDNGFVAYLAGGCVRDTLLGRPPKDFDVATNAEPDRIAELFTTSHAVGEAFGVQLVPVREGRQRFVVEVATFRTEWGYADGRRPTSIRFTDARHDAARRDFTINGLFEDPLARSGQDPIIDFVEGRADLARGIVRAIGDPEQRFGEDYLRMLRAVRFAARFDFAIESATRQAIMKHAAHLGRISAERVGQETRAMLTPDADARPPRAVHLIQELHLDATLLGEPHAEPAIPTVDALPDHADYPTVLAAWLLDRRTAEAGTSVCGSLSAPTAAAPLRQQLCLSNDHHDAVTSILALAGRAVAWPTLTLAPRKRLVADRRWPQAFCLLQAHLPHHDPTLDQCIMRDVEGLEGQEVAPDPLLRGEDLMAMGFEQGPAMGRLLAAVYDAQLEGHVANREQAMQWLRDHG